MLTLKVRRDKDFAGTAFPDPEGALAFALRQPGYFARTGTLRIQLQGVVTNTTLYLLNVGVQGISMADWLGVAPSFDYHFNGGLISTVSPL